MNDEAKKIKVQERIANLRALAANNPNEHEAQSAAAMADKLAEKHDIDESHESFARVAASITFRVIVRFRSVRYPSSRVRRAADRDIFSGGRIPFGEGGIDDTDGVTSYWRDEAGNKCPTDREDD